MTARFSWLHHIALQRRRFFKWRYLILFSGTIGIWKTKFLVFKPLAAYADIMKQAGIPDFATPISVKIQQGILENALTIESNDFEKILGRPAMSIEKGSSQVVGCIS